MRSYDQLLNDATSKLDDALSSTALNRKRVTVAKMILNTAKTKYQDAVDILDKIRKKQKSFNRTSYKLLDKALQSKEILQKKQGNESEEKSYKKSKPKQWEIIILKSIVETFVVLVAFYFRDMPDLIL